MTLLHGTDTSPLAGTPTGHDPSERLRDELERLRVENRTLVRLNRLQGRFVAMASHEFKTPLTSITAYTEVLLNQVEGPEHQRTREFLGVIGQESARLLRMINRILDFSRLEYGSRLLQRDPVDLGELARETLRSFGAAMAARGQESELVAAPALPVTAADSDLLRQALVNLVGNAVKYAPPGGQVRLTLCEEAATIALEVADDGPGIPSVEMARVFQEFYRAPGSVRDAEGTGLGLSIVRHIVALHGGHVTVRRRSPRGTAFTIHLPKLVTVPAVARPQDEGREHAVLRNTLRLLSDFTDSRAAVLLLSAGEGGATPVAHMGLPAGVLPDAATFATPVATDDAAAWLAILGLDKTGRPDREAWLLVPVAADGAERGWALLGRRCNARSFGPRDRDQAGVMGRLAARALAAAAGDPARALEALRVLLRIRWRGVPTATAEALDLASSLARSLGMSPAEVARLQDAVALHDAGMDRIEDEILCGHGDLSPDDREEIDRHVALGLDLLAPLLTEDATAEIIRHHHERWDGGGYPDGLRGAEIPHGARTLAVIDAWFSLTRGRPSRPGMASDRALEEITGGAGTQFDPDAVAALMRLVANRPGVGSSNTPGSAPAGT